MKTHAKNEGVKKIFSDIHSGDVFKCKDGCLYIKSYDGCENFNAVNLETGQQVVFSHYVDIIVPTSAVCEIEW